MIYKINQTPLLLAEILRHETYAANNTTPSDRLTYQSVKKLRKTGVRGDNPHSQRPPQFHPRKLP